MKPINSFIVTANLPNNISKLNELAYNYWWCWDFDAKELFKRIDNTIWKEIQHNPVLLLNKVPQSRLNQLASEDEFVSFLEYVYAKYTQYLEAVTWYDKLKERQEGTIAYFSPEYGINESFPNYSGGLGVLAGDHLKSASDLGIPLVAVGLLYQQGYFRQHLNQNGWQNEIYLYNDFFNLPIELVKNGNKEPLVIDVDLSKGKAFAQIWKMRVGRVDLYLLDTNISLNKIDHYRTISNQLYGGDRDTRIQQEIMHGIGGMRALNRMGISPHALHINEGHAAFALMERSRILMNEHHISFGEACEITKASSIFTTHTPVPAGNEEFKIDRINNYLGTYIDSLGISKEEFISFGQTNGFDNSASFSMTILGLRMSAYRNGVSKLHGVVARKMWSSLWENYSQDDTPIKGLTNGVHTHTWLARELSELYDRYLSPNWRSEPDNKNIWNKIDNIPDEEIWRVKQSRRLRLVLSVRKYLKKVQKEFLAPEQLKKIDDVLNPDALTIGFARRFATYKRATLIFTNMERLKKILTNPEKPVQILIAGKAHPHDTQGKEVIQHIIQQVRKYGLENHVVFLEDYDMIIARLLVKGCDIWLNNPIRPLEASGTSGMKAGLNGALNLSILDGWWDESFNGSNGFAFGSRDYEYSEQKDIIESEELYDILDSIVIKMFYDKTHKRPPTEWLNYIKNSIKTITPEFSTSRMLKDYTHSYYIDAIRRNKQLQDNNAELAKVLHGWKQKIYNSWSRVEVIDVTFADNKPAHVGKKMEVSTVINLGDLFPNDVIVQVIYGSIDHDGELINTGYEFLEHTKSEGEYHNYTGSYKCRETGMQGMTIRILPKNVLLDDSSEMHISKIG